MHELGVARRIVTRAVAAAGAAELAALRLRLGPEGGFEAGALELSLRAAGAGTPAEGAAIEIRAAETGGVVLESVVVKEPA
jgi:Zn finger protein HypA/HybF involved in hydrogenase expression